MDLKSKISEKISMLSVRARQAWFWAKLHPMPVIAALSVFVFFYAALLISTMRIRHGVADYLKEATGGDFEYKGIHVTPTFRIVLEEAQLTAKNSVLSLPDFTAKRVVVGADVLSLLGGRMRLIEIKLDEPVVRIYKGPDGRYNMSRWIGKAGVCDAKSVGPAVPNRVTVREGRVLMEPPPGATWFEAIEVARVDGFFGRTPENNIGVKFRANIFQSDVNISGGLVPCDPDDFEFSGFSENFSFSGLREFAEKVFDESVVTDRMPGGTGSLRFSLGGSYDNPVFQGDVSLRDFDTSFSIGGNMLRLSNFRAGIGDEKLSGSGMFDFSKQDIPFKLTLAMKNMNVERLFRKEFGFRNAPEGSLSGNARLRGRLKDFQVEWEDGEITISDGILKIPPPGAGEKSANPVVIPFKTLSSKLAGSEGSLSFINISLDSDVVKAAGSATIGGISGFEIFSPGVSYALRLDFSAEDAASFAELFPSLHDRLGGSMEGNIGIEGTYKRVRDFKGDGRITIKKGFVGNPYTDQGTSLPENIEFELAKAEFSLGDDALRLSNATISGNGIFIEIHGDIGYDGDLNLAGKAQLTFDWGARFYGLVQYMRAGELDQGTLYEAGFTVTGNVRSPEQFWQEPSTVQWQ